MEVFEAGNTMYVFQKDFSACSEDEKLKQARIDTI